MTEQPYTNYNDVAIGSFAWENNLPWAVESFLVIGDGDEELHSMRQVHSDFLSHYGLTAAEVPLLRLREECIKASCWLEWGEQCARLTRADKVQCFVDV